MVMRRALPVSLTVCVTLLAAACGTPSAPAPAASSPATPWPTKNWTMATPEAEGLDAGVLATLDAEFAAGAHGYIDSMLVVRHGRLVFERSYTHDYKALFEAGNR